MLALQWRMFPSCYTCFFSRLEYMLQGVRRSLPASTCKQRLPITPKLLRAIHHSWSTSAPTFNKTMLWAAFCLGFFEFMRSGEFICLSLERFRDDMLSIQDVAVDSHSHTTILAIRLWHSKTDAFGVGVTLYVGCTGDTLCPVSAMLAYLAVRPKTPGPLFIYKDGTPLSRTCLIRELRLALESAGIQSAQFSGHSFRIGAATTAAQVGLSDALIKTLGRWQSSAYTRYIRTPQYRLAAVSRALVSTPHSHTR